MGCPEHNEILDDRDAPELSWWMLLHANDPSVTLSAGKISLAIALRMKAGLEWNLDEPGMPVDHIDIGFVQRQAHPANDIDATSRLKCGIESKRGFFQRFSFRASHAFLQG